MTQELRPAVESDRESPKITFSVSSDLPRAILTLEADGKIILHDDADPTEAAKAMERLLHDMLQQREDETVEQIVAWLRATPRGMLAYEDYYADAIEAGEWKQ